MLWNKNSQRIANHFLSSFMCFEFVLSATTETAFETEDDDDDAGIYNDDEDILRLDFFRFTTRKRYIWEDWTVPTRDPEDYESNNSFLIFLFYFFIPVLVCLFVGSLLYICIKKLNNDCCSAESDSSSRSTDRYTTVHRPPQRRTHLSTEVHMPPNDRNQFSESRRQLFGEPAIRDLFNELDGMGGSTNDARMTIDFVNNTYFSPSQNGTDPVIAGTAVSDKPPDYSAVTFSDLVSPESPAFPVVKRDGETPPPKYGKENPFFK